MFVFIIANLPLPVIFYLNCVVTLKFLKVRRLSQHTPVAKPKQLVTGWWLGNISTIFALAPMAWEHRIFVQNHWWLVSYLIAATFSITGLVLMDRGLGEELRALTKRKHQRRQVKPVDMAGSDKL